MSRFGEGDGDENFNNETWFWMKRAELALRGRRGRKALQELREALLALPEKRLIERAACTVGLTAKVAAMPDKLPGWHDPEAVVDNWKKQDLAQLVEQQGEGVCAVAAFAWHKLVKGGLSPEEAFAKLPTIPDTDGGEDETAELGKQYGLTYTLAWELGAKNDSTFENLSAERRWQGFMDWIDEQLAKPLLTRPVKPPKAVRVKRAAKVAPTVSTSQVPLW